jgi:citronellol/citronellal dehydrogenase
VASFFSNAWSFANRAHHSHNRRHDGEKVALMSLKNKTLFITGGSRGIGLAIALRAARDGANVAIAAKTAKAHPKLPGTIYTAATEVESAGGNALPLVVDVRDEGAVLEAVRKTVERFGGIDICVNNASAIGLTGTEATEMKRFDLMHQINVRGTFLTSKACIPHLKRAANPHVLTLSPPLELRPEWFGAHLAYTLSKYGMSMCMLGMAEEFRADGIAFNTLWPRTTIATAAVEFMLGGEEMLKRSRSPEIMADAAHAILTKPSRSFTGRFLIDDAVLYDEGVRDFDRYRCDPSKPLMVDLFVDPKADTPAGTGI